MSERKAKVSFCPMSKKAHIPEPHMKVREQSRLSSTERRYFFVSGSSLSSSGIIWRLLLCRLSFDIYSA